MLIPSGAIPPSRPSADLLLTTLGLALGPRAVAVVMSGSGRDGATGATAVHRCGGTGVATSPASSTHAGMPEETIARAGITDAVVELDDLPAFLVQLVTAPQLDSTGT